MLSNKDINFDDARQILTINGEEHAVGDPAIPGEIEELDDRVTALEEGGGGEYEQIITGTINSVSGGLYGRVNVDVSSYKSFIIFAKKQSESIYHTLTLPAELVTHNREIGDGTFAVKRWSSSDARLGIALIETGTFDYILFAK